MFFGTDVFSSSPFSFNIGIESYTNGEIFNITLFLQQGLNIDAAIQKALLKDFGIQKQTTMDMSLIKKVKS
jgi:hypothetical protein|tara:strand:+ start:910 stop:1122 length:213 start_codon:yes stop_codon:yes gene_type:complete